jgi:hypothetical protein
MLINLSASFLSFAKSSSSNQWICDVNIGSERFATMAAIEMLLPWCLRGRMRAMANEGLTDLKIAQEFRAPEKFVNLILRSNYGQISDETNSFKTVPAQRPA